MQTQEPSSTAHLTRQLDIIPIDCLDQKITVIGAGAIGSFAVLALAKMGFTNIMVFDDDKVDVENMNCQFYRFGDIGKLKVEALAHLVDDFTGVKIEAVSKRYEGGQFPGIVISAVDSMAARRLIWDNHAMKAPFTKAVVDPRMGAESALMYVMDPMAEADVASYEKTLYTDQEAVQERCTAKATMYTAIALSGHVAKAVKDLATGGNHARTTLWSIKDNEQKCFNVRQEAN